MPKKLPYEHLPLVPTIIADAVCGEVYTGREWSLQVRDGNLAAKVEERRKLLSEEQRREFADLAEKWCRAAYEANADWFMKIARSKTNRGRDQLYNVIRHWFSAYCMDPVGFKQKIGGL